MADTVLNILLNAQDNTSSVFQGVTDRVQGLTEATQTETGALQDNDSALQEVVGDTQIQDDASASAAGSLEDLGTSAEDASSGLTDMGGAETESAGAADQAGESTQGLNVDLGDLKEGVGGALEKLTGFSLQTLTVVGGLAAVGEALKSSIDDFVAEGDEIKSLGIITGQSNEDISKIISSMGMLGVSSNTVQSALDFAIRKGFQPTIENLKEFADKFNATQDPVQRGQMLISTFGRSAGPELADYLSKGSAGIQDLIDKAVTIGDVMSEKDVEAADKYKEAQGELNAVWSAAKIQVGDKLVPVLTDLLDVLTKSSEEVDKSKVKWIEYIPVLGYAYDGFTLLVNTMDKIKGVNKDDTEATTTLTAATEQQTSLINNSLPILQNEWNMHWKLEDEKYKEADATNALNSTIETSNERLAGYAAAINGPLGKANTDFIQKNQDLQNKLADVNQQIDTLKAQPYLTDAQRTQMTDLVMQQGSISEAIIKTGTDHKTATDQIMLDMALQEIKSAELSGKLSSDQATAAEESVYQWGAAEGLIDQDTLAAYDTMQGYINYIKTEGPGAWESFADYVNQNPISGSADFTVHYVDIHTIEQSYTPNTTNTTPGPVIPNKYGHQGGGSFIIPPGFNESWPLGGGHVASSGEKVTVEPVNNYINYNLQAHYPVYQDPHAARNDLIGMMMLRNIGAAKWVTS